jgi:hypothetical protein
MDDARKKSEGSDLFALRPDRDRQVPGQPGGKMPALIPQLEKIQREFEALSRQAKELTNGIAEEQFTWRPFSNRWSIAECLLHLHLQGSDLLPALDKAINQARSRSLFSWGPFKVTWLGRWFIKGTEPPVRKRWRSPKRHVPPRGQSINVVLPGLLDLHRRVNDLMNSANGMDLSKIKVTPPGWPLFSLNLLEMFMYLAAHERRHIEQAWQVRYHDNFPKKKAAKHIVQAPV